MLVDGRLYVFYPGLGTSYWIALSGLDLLFAVFAQGYPYLFATTVPLKAWS